MQLFQLSCIQYQLFLRYLGSLRLLGLDPLDLGERDVEVGAVLLVAPRNLPQLLLALFEQVLVQEGTGVVQINLIKI